MQKAYIKEIKISNFQGINNLELSFLDLYKKPGKIRGTIGDKPSSLLYVLTGFEYKYTEV